MATESRPLSMCDLGFTEESFVIRAPDEAVARQLKKSIRWAASQALRLGKVDTKILYPGCEKPYSILAEWAEPSCFCEATIHQSLSTGINGETLMMVADSDTVQRLYTSPNLPIVKQLLQVVERMIDSDRPMFLLANDTDDQLWLNELACNMIQSSGARAVQRCMRDYWANDSLDDLHKKLRETSQPFDHPYRAILNDEQNDVWFEAVSTYEPIEIGGRSFRLSVNKHFNIIGKAQLQTYR